MGNLLPKYPTYPHPSTSYCENTLIGFGRGRIKRVRFIEDETSGSPLVMFVQQEIAD